MHLALKAYQELLLTVNEMDRSLDESIRQSCHVIKSTTHLKYRASSILFPVFPHSLLLPRQHFLPDGVQGDLLDLAEEV